MAKAKNEIIKEAEVEIKYFTASEEAQYLEDMRDLWESDRTTELRYAERKRNRKAEKKNGEKKNKIKTAKKLLEKNLPLEEIIEVTELSKEEIKKIKNNL